MYTKCVKTQDKGQVNVVSGTKTVADMFQQIQTDVKEIKAKRLFIDSLTSLKISSDRSGVGGSRVRAIEILKMRGAKHDAR